MNKNYRIVNIRYIVDGLHFDAAIDCDWQLHAYDLKCFPDKSENITPVELYCLDNPDWDIRMVWYKIDNSTVNQQQPDEYSSYPRIFHTWCNFEEILEETRKWIKEETNDTGN